METMSGRSAMERAVVFPLEFTLGHLLRRAQQVHTSLWTAEFGGRITGPQFGVLTALAQHGAIDQNSARLIVSLDRSTAADVVARLERNGWVSRERDSVDGRRNRLRLSDASRTSIQELTSRAVRVQQRLMASVDEPERARFLGTLAFVAYAGEVPHVTDRRGEGRRSHLRLEAASGHLVRRAEQIHGLHWQRHVGARLTPSQFGLLTAVASADQLDQREAGRRASLDKSSSSEISSRLITRGLMRRTRDLGDKRRNLLELTDEAWELLTQLEPAVLKVQADLAALLASDDLQFLTSRLRLVAYET